MPLLRDRVRETTTTVGTGTITLGGAVTGYQSFNTAFTNGDTTYYVIQGGTEWEIGIGTIGAGTLARTAVLQSSNADALVPFAAGTKDVFCSYVADRAVTTSDAATLTNKTLDDYTNNVGANSTHFRIKATGTISKGQVVKATGFTPGENAIEVAVVTSATDLALGIAESALTTGQFGLAVVIGELFDVNTNGLSVGAIIYSNGTGGYTTTKPSSGTYQPLGWVVRANTNNGVIAVNIVAPLYVETSTNTANTAVLRDGSGNFAAATITATLNGAAPAGSLTGTTLASNVVSSSLTSVGTLSSLTVSGNLTVDTNTLFVDSANNRVGIGTTNPTEELTVVGTDNTTVSPTTFWTTGFVGAEISNASTTLNTVSGIMLSSGERNAVAGIGGIRISSTAQAIGFFTGGSGSVPERMRITETGNVGIGTTSPAAGYLLTVGSGSAAANAAVALNGGTDANFGSGIAFRRGGVSKGFIGTESWVTSGTSDDVTLYASAASALRFYSNGAYRWSINTSGHFLAATDASFDIGASGANRPRNVFVSGNGTFGGTLAVNATSNTVSFSTSADGTAQAISRLDSTSTTRDTLNPALLLFNGGTVTQNQLVRLAFSSGSGARTSIIGADISAIFTGDGTGNGRSTALAFSTADQTVAQTPTERMRITSTGNVGIGTTSPAYYMDIGSSSGTVDLANAALRIRRSGVATNWSRFDNVNGVLNINQYDATTPIIRFQTSTDGSTFTERMRLDASGNLGLGVTPSAWGASFKALQVSTASLWSSGGSNALIGANYYHDGTNRRFLHRPLRHGGQRHHVHAGDDAGCERESLAWVKCRIIFPAYFCQTSCCKSVRRCFMQQCWQLGSATIS